MTSGDEEMEDLWLESVTNYYFENETREPVSFSDLPIRWSSSETIQSSYLKIYVCGDAGGSRIYELVKAWKFDISGVKPEISVVLCKNNNWIKLEKPRKSFEEECIRTILVAVNFLHLVKRNPKLPGNHIWKKLSSIFSCHDTKPSMQDLVDHVALIEHAGVQDESLKKSKCFMAVLEGNPQMKQIADEDDIGKGKSQFVVNDDDVSLDDLEDDSRDEKDGSIGKQNDSDDKEDNAEAFDSVCSICDEGGSLLCCEGSCMRSFHATLRAGKPSKCRSLGFTEKKLKDMDSFVCQNCQYKLHQCFACGKLGSSDKQAGAEVYKCVNATCGYFYHPHCVAKLLQVDEDDAKELEEIICAGESFSCPLHICTACKHVGDESNPEMQMAVCRRCPTAFHKKCLPKEIALAEDEDGDDDEDIEQRAWKGLLVDRILMYCLKHDIDEDLGTPIRDHIQFTSEDKKEKGTSTGVSAEKKVSSKRKTPALRASSKASSAIESKKKTKLPSKEKPVVQSSRIKEQTCFQGEDVVNPTQTEKLGEIESTNLSKDAVKTFVLDSDSERWILNLMNEASSMITLEDIIEKHGELIPSHLYMEKMDPCKSITLGKVEGSCKALHEAAKKLNEGRVKEAESICGPTILNQMVKWKGKLRVYLAPFLHGMRYTSFGRRFIKYGKLEEIADILHWYVNDNDTIVDFCCGANDFSLLMKERLENQGKQCNYKNYDIFRPKNNDFCFEKRDWMSVRTDELPTGSKLIMGINPPYGVKANQFINKALEFKPKLIILTVPAETERLDEKEEGYDLIFDNKEKLLGKSFYFPGLIDVNGKQLEGGHTEPPILSLWSRPDWTSKHLEIAKTYHHLPGNQRENFSSCAQSFNNNRDSGFKETEGDNVSPYTLQPEGTKEVVGDEDTEKNSTHNCDYIDKHVNATHENSKTKEGSKQKRQREVMQGGETSRGYKRKWFSQYKPYYESRKGRQYSDLRYQGSSINGHFDHRTHHTSSSALVRDQGHGSNDPYSDVVERYLPSDNSRFNLGHHADRGHYQQHQGPPRQGYRHHSAYRHHPTSWGGWIDG